MFHLIYREPSGKIIFWKAKQEFGKSWSAIKNDAEIFESENQAQDVLNGFEFHDVKYEIIPANDE